VVWIGPAELRVREDRLEQIGVAEARLAELRLDEETPLLDCR
jgi:hypothetical protein